MSLRLKVFHKGLILVGVPLLLGLLLIAGLWYLLYQSEKARAQEAIYRKGAVLTARLVALTFEVPMLVAASMEYRSDKIFKAYERNIELIRKYTAEVNSIRQQCPEIKVEFKDALQRSQEKVIATAEKFAAERKQKYVLDKLVQLSREMNVVSTEASSTLHQMQQHGLIETARTRRKQEEIRKQQSIILFGGFLANLAAALSLAAFYRRDLLYRIKQITENTIALARSESMKNELGGSDEIALVDHSFHEMQRRLQEAGERERSLFENASDLICVLDEERKVLQINPVSKQDLGYEAESLLGNAIEEILESSDRDTCLASIFEARKSGRPVLLEAGVTTSWGQRKEMLWSISWSEQELRYFCIAHDLTEQRRLERNREQFLSLMSQDLREPLSAISASFEELLTPQSNSLSPAACEKLHDTGKNVQRLLDLVDELLHINERQSNLLAIRKEKIKIGELLTEAVSSMEALAGQKHIRLELDFVDDFWSVDKARIMQVLVNLISNAIKFSGEDGIVKLAVCRSSEKYFECSIADRGRGVPDKQKQLIFEKFSQVESADAKRHSGTGLGLPICRKIVEGHGGEIKVRDNPDGGSIFCFSIPVHEPVGGPELPEQLLPVNLQLDSEIKWLPEKRKSAAFLHLGNRLSLGIKGAILVGLPVLCEIWLVLALSNTLHEVDKQREEELHQRLVSNAANAWMVESVGVLSKLAHEYNDADWASIQQDLKAAYISRDKLYKLVADDKKQLAYLKKADEYFEVIEDACREAKKSVQENRSVFLPFSERHQIAPILLKLCHEMKRIIDVAENRENAAPDKERVLGRQQEAVLLCGLIANVVSSILLAVYFSRDINSRLMVLADNAGRLASEKDLNEPLLGTDEIARLDKAFHESARALSELRKKERSILDNSQDLICVTDEQGKFLSLNPACLRIWGYKREELLDGKTIFELLLPEDESVSRSCFAADKDGDSRFTLENRVLKKNGELAFMLWSVSRKSGKQTFYCVAHDITARKELEALKQEFLAMVSHDLRSPLTAISGYVQLVRQGKFGQISNRDESILASIASSCRSLVNLIGDLLDLEKLEAGKLSLQKEEVEFCDLLEEVMKTTIAPDRLKLDYSPELDETVLIADLDRIKQALASILNFVLVRSKLSVRLRVQNKPGLSELSVLEQNNLPLSESEKRQFALRDLGALLSESNGQKAGTRLSLALSARILSEHGGGIEFSEKDGFNIYEITIARQKTLDEEDADER